MKAILLFSLILFLSACSSKKNDSELPCKIKTISHLNQYKINKQKIILYEATIEKAGCHLTKYGKRYIADISAYFTLTKKNPGGSSFIKSPIFVAVLNKYTKEIYHKKLYTLKYDTQHKNVSHPWKNFNLDFSLPKSVELEDIFLLIGFQQEDVNIKKNKE